MGVIYPYYQKMEIKTINVEEMRKYLSDYETQAATLTEKLNWIQGQVSKYKNVLEVVDELALAHMARPIDRFMASRKEYVIEVMRKKDYWNAADIRRGMIGLGWSENCTENALFSWLLLKNQKNWVKRVAPGLFTLVTTKEHEESFQEEIKKIGTFTKR